eukprot:5713513-Pleurochrysis_carterae.AAC.3
MGWHCNSCVCAPSHCWKAGWPRISMKADNMCNADNFCIGQALLDADASLFRSPILFEVSRCVALNFSNFPYVRAAEPRVGGHACREDKLEGLRVCNPSFSGSLPPACSRARSLFAPTRAQP